MSSQLRSSELRLLGIGVVDVNRYISRFQNTKYPELTFRALLAENSQEVRFELRPVDQKGRGQIV